MGEGWKTDLMARKIESESEKCKVKVQSTKSKKSSMIYLKMKKYHRNG